MNLNNLCTAAWLALELAYARHKKECDKDKIVLYFNLLTEPDDEFDNNPFGIQIIARSYVTNYIESHVFTEEILKGFSHPANELIIPKMKSMIESVKYHYKGENYGQRTKEIN